MAKTDLLSPDILRKLLRYEPETGRLFWRERGIRRWDAANAGKEAFAISTPSGYRCGHVNGVMTLAHRAAWMIYYGERVGGQIDHVNGDRADNRVSNLRVVTNAENSKNQRIPKSNKSGVIGVSWDSARAKWKASIKVDGRSLHLGNFCQKSEAVEARRAAEINFGFHPNHGRAAEELDGGGDDTPEA